MGGHAGAVGVRAAAVPVTATLHAVLAVLAVLTVLAACRPPHDQGVAELIVRDLG